MADECDTCAEIGGYGEGDVEAVRELDGRCPQSRRPCGHHCNHLWTNDSCHWCDGEWDPETETFSTEVPRVG
jgi:hypothetical protein